VNRDPGRPSEPGLAAEQSEAWERELETFLRDAERVLVLGIGNEIRADDAVGTYAARMLCRAFTQIRLRVPCLAFPGGAAPENFIGPTLEFDPTHIVLVDAMDWGAPVGSVSSVDPASLGGVSLSSHSMPLGVLRDYLVRSGCAKLLVLGVQPSTIELGRDMSREVRSSGRRIVRAILRTLGAGVGPRAASRRNACATAEQTGCGSVDTGYAGC